MLTEYEEQKLIFEYMNHVKNPALKLLTASMMGVKLSIGQATKAKRSGSLAGWPDIQLAVSRGGYHGLFIELKRLKGGVVSLKQKLILNQLAEEGYKASVCKGHKAAIKEILDYLNL